MAGNHYVVLNYKLLKACPDPATAVILAELCKWDEFYRKDHSNRLEWLPVDFHAEPGWFYKTEDEWEEIGITPRVLRRAKAFLKENGILLEQMKGSPPKLWFRLNSEALEAFLAQPLQSVRVTNRKGYESSLPTLTNRKGSINKESLKTITIDIPPISPTKEPDEFLAWFEDFESRGFRTAGNAGSARKKYERLRKTYTAEQMLLATKNYYDSLGPKGWNCHAKTFLQPDTIAQWQHAPSRASPSGQEDEWDRAFREAEQLQRESQCLNPSFAN